MTQRIYNLVFYDEFNGLKYVDIDDIYLKKVSLIRKGKSKRKYNIEEIDNITSFYEVDTLKDILNLNDGYFFVISERNKTYHKRHAIFDDEEIRYVTEDIFDCKTPELLSVKKILEDKDFVNYLDEESIFYNVGDKKLKETIHKLNNLYNSKEEEIDIENEIRYLKNYYAKNIDTYLKYRDFYVAYRDYKDKTFISNIDEVKEQSLFKRKEEELVELVDKYNHDEIDEEQYISIRKDILSDITDIKLKKYELQKAKKRIIKR